MSTPTTEALNLGHTKQMQQLRGSKLALKIFSQMHSPKS
jgi:hypothetical protein